MGIRRSREVAGGLLGGAQASGIVDVKWATTVIGGDVGHVDHVTNVARCENEFGAVDRHRGQRRCV